MNEFVSLPPWQVARAGSAGDAEVDGLVQGDGGKGHVKDQGQPLEHAGKLLSGKRKTATDNRFAGLFPMLRKLSGWHHS